MKAYVITIKDNHRSVQAAERCIRSAAQYGIDVKMSPAITPKDKPVKMFEDRLLPIGNFIKDAERYSRYENGLSCFLSHYCLWQQCSALNEITMILEHDAVFVDKIPTFHFDKVISLGRPSYGKWNTPSKLGVNPLTSKQYFPGAHAYLLTPNGANDLLCEGLFNAAPTDVFLNLKNFSWLQEYYPWPVEAQDSFTTVQKEAGCYAKHNYNETYKVV